MTRLDRVATVQARIGWKALTADEYVDDGNIFLATPNIKSRDIDFENVNYISTFRYEESPELKLRLGDVLLAKDGSTLGIANHVRHLPGPATVNGSIAVVRPHSVEPPFLTYWLQGQVIQSRIQELKDGMGVPHLFQQDIRKLPVPDLEPEEQRRIADFLDDRVARIDRVIAARQSQLESNREHLRSVVEEVFDGHVERVRASRVMRVLPGFAFPSDEFSHDDGDVPLLRGINVGVGSLRWDDIVYWPHERLSEVQGFLLSEGDVVLGMDRPWIGGGLRIAQLDRSDGRPLLLQRVAKLSSDGYLSPRFIFWAYQSEQFRQQVESDLTGLSVPHLSGDQILSYQIPALSRSDQRWATDRLDAAQSAVASAGQLLVRSIALLAEYKQSLITAAVTGEFDVTTAGSGIPG